MLTFDVRFEGFKEMFFDRRAVRRAVDRARQKALSKAGAFVRTAARSRIRPARQMSLGEMTSEERAAHQKYTRIARQKGRPPPKRPRASSKPGESPRSQTGLLKRFIFFGYDQATDTVVIGPAKLGGRKNAPEVLEYGGHVTLKSGRDAFIEPRPYMGPALEQELDRLPRLWANSVRG